LRRLGIRYAITIHGRYSHIFDEKLQTMNRISALYLKVFERKVLEQASFVQAITPLEYSIVEHVAPGARIELVPNAAYSSAADAITAAPDRKTTSSNFPTFGFCGRFAVEHKGIDLLLEGFAQYQREAGRGRLVLIGTGPLRETLRALIEELDLGDSVELGGPLFGDEKQSAVRSWDFFAMPSRFDVLPTAALEAALLGTPLIVSTATGFKPYLDQFGGGFSISSLRAEAVAQALQQASRLSAPEWVQMSRGTYEMALAIGDWTSISASLEELYQKHAVAA
jgi:glycosyltransferase involved in cell wall biosynthesis